MGHRLQPRSLPCVQGRASSRASRTGPEPCLFHEPWGCTNQSPAVGAQPQPRPVRPSPSCLLCQQTHSLPASASLEHLGSDFLFL